MPTNNLHITGNETMNEIKTPAGDLSDNEIQNIFLLPSQEHLKTLFMKDKKVTLHKKIMRYSEDDIQEAFMCPSHDHLRNAFKDTLKHQTYDTNGVLTDDDIQNAFMCPGKDALIEAFINP